MRTAETYLLNQRKLTAVVLLAVATLVSTGANAAVAIVGTWWSGEADNNGDGCWAPTSAGAPIRLNWDVDVPSGGAATVYEKIYFRNTGTTAWQLETTTAQHLVVGTTSADAQFLDVTPPGGCQSRDYLIEVYESGAATASDTRSPDNDPNLSAHSEQSFLDDNPPAVIFNAWWTQAADQNQDGCYAPTGPTLSMRLNWDADVVGGGTLQVYEKVYQRMQDSQTWALLFTTTAHTITGTSSLDAQYVEVPSPAACAAFDYKIELYGTGSSTPMYVLGPDRDADLSYHREESYAQDSGPIIADAWWSNAVDHNADGCWAPASPTGALRLNWNPDIAGGGSMAVYERVYSKPSGSTNWNLLTTTSRHTVTGTDTNDVQYLDVTPAAGCAAMDYKIELALGGSDQASYTRGPANDPDLAAHKEQSYAEDNATTKISRVWWSNVADKDLDGCVAPLSQNGLMRLNWDANVTDNTSVTVFGKVYWRQTGTTAWNLALSSAPELITGSSTNDSQYVDIDPGTGCSAYDYRIELYQVGTTTPDDSKDSQNEPTLAAHKEESYSQDAAPIIAGAWWTRVTDNDKDGCVAPAAKDSLMRLNWNPDVAGAGTMTAYEKVYRRTGAADWVLIYTSPQHDITGSDTNDIQFVDLPPAGGCTLSEYKIEIYRNGLQTPSFALTGAADPDLGPRKEETWAEDNTLTVASVAWLNTADNDGDGCVAPATSKGGYQLRWDVDVVSGGSLSLYENVSRKVAGAWSLLTTTPPHTVTGTSTADAQQVEITPAGQCLSAEYRIEVFQAGHATPDITIGSATAPALAPRLEETYAMDNPNAGIAGTWWSNQADHDGDGCMAPTAEGIPFRLNWNPIVQGSGTFNVLEKVYRRIDSGSWVQVGVTFPQPVTAGDTNVVHFADFFGESGCAVVDYKLEIYREGQAQPDTVIGPADDAKLSQRKEETYTEDNQSVRLLGAWWTNLADNDGDGCFAPASRTGRIRLNWDADVAGSGSVSVYTIIYAKEITATNWTAVITNAPYMITGGSGTNASFADIPTPGGCKIMQYRIDLYRTNDISPAATLTPQNDPDLAVLTVEAYDEDNVLAKISYVWWSATADADGDGCVAPDVAGGKIRLNWDPDVQGSGSLNVFEKIYTRNTGTTDWKLLQTTPVHQITGNSAADAGFLDLDAADSCTARDYRVELYRAGISEVDDVKDPSNENLLKAHREETYAQDNEKALLVKTWWSDVADRDQDGCFAPLAPSGSMRLNWDADVDGTGTMNVMAKVYSRIAGETNWTLVVSSAPYNITGATTNDAQYAAITPASNCTVSEYKIELYRAGVSTPDAVRDPDNDANLRHKEESYLQDPGVPPMITTQPQSQKVDTGTAVTFSVVAAGSQPLRYQWYFQSTNLIANATNASVVVQNAGSANAGSYSVTVTNDFGVARSALATLSLNSLPPTITTQPQSQKVDTGTAITFTVVATGSQPLRYQWYFQSTNVIANATNASVVVQNAGSANVGSYSVTVTNDFGVARSAAAILSLNSTKPPVVSNPGITTGGLFQFTITGSVGDIYQVEYTAGLTSWQAASTLTNTTGSAVFTDPSAQANARFYRVRLSK